MCLVMKAKFKCQNKGLEVFQRKYKDERKFNIKYIFRNAYFFNHV